MCELERELLTFRELCERVRKHNEENHVERQFEDKKRLTCYVVIKQMPYWKQQYSEIERTYKFASDNKFFIAGLGGNSIFADCVGDPNDKGVRLDWYLGDWEIEKCWIEEGDK